MRVTRNYALFDVMCRCYFFRHVLVRHSMLTNPLKAGLFVRQLGGTSPNLLPFCRSHFCSSYMDARVTCACSGICKHVVNKSFIIARAFVRHLYVCV